MLRSSLKPTILTIINIQKNENHWTLKWKWNFELWVEAWEASFYHSACSIAAIKLYNGHQPSNTLEVKTFELCKIIIIDWISQLLFLWSQLVDQVRKMLDDQKCGSLAWSYHWDDWYQNNQQNLFSSWDPDWWQGANWCCYQSMLKLDLLILSSWQTRLR